jgi:HEAT repeat protein
MTKRGNTGSEDQWEFWWEANDDAFLNLKDRMRRGHVSTAISSQLTSRLSSERNELASRTTAEDRARIVAVLLGSLDSKEADIVDSAVLSLARIVRAEDASSVLPAVIKVLSHPERTPRQSAALALGVLGAPEAVPTLRELLLDTPEGRRLTGQTGAVEDFVRAFAAASLGMIGSPEVAPDLKRVVVDPSLRANDDVKSLAVLALGLVKDGHETIVPVLQSVLADRSLAPVVRAQAPIALARIAEQPNGRDAARAALSSLVGRFLEEREDDVKRSLAIAFGRIATLDDAEVVSTLADATQGKDALTRHFALMALADLGARDPAPDHHADAQKKLAELFRNTLQKPKQLSERPYAALAMAVHARGERVELADRSIKERAKETLHEMFVSENNPSYRGAFAIGLGLLGALEADEDLHVAFEDSRDAPMRGYVAVAFGLMLDHKRADEVRDLIDDKGIETRFRLQLARSLGLLGDAGAVPTLLQTLEQAQSQYEVSSTVQALGLIGDRTAVDPLVKLFGDPSQVPLRRGFAAVALGLLAEKSELPWNAVFTVASNYRAKTPALAEIFDIL